MAAEHGHFSIEIDGQEVSDLYPDLDTLEVEQDDELANMFKLRLLIRQQSDSTWSYLDDERLVAWKPVTVIAGFESGTEELLTGYITHVKPYFDPDPALCTLEIWGMDSSVLMDQEEKLKDWPNKKDSDIAAEIFSAYGFSPEVDDTVVIHDEAMSTIIQRETDMQFLKRLALRNGFECFVQGSRGLFRNPLIEDTPQPVMAVHFGGETNVSRFSIEVNALTPANVGMVQVDRANKEVNDVTIERSLQLPLGSTDSPSLLGRGVDPGKVFIGMNAATGNPEMTNLCQGLFHQAEWFVTGEGEVTSDQYGHVLQPRKPVTIKGIGETYSGVYYVTHVTHSFSSAGYKQFFKVKRNALMPTGAEDFTASAGLLSGLI